MFKYLLDSSDRAVEQFVFGAWEAFLSSSQPWLTSVLIIFLALLGYAILMGRIDVSRSELGPRLLKMVVILVFLVRPGPMDRFVYHVATDVPGAVASTLVRSLGNTSSDINASLDELFVNGAKASGKMWKQAGLFDASTVLIGLLIYAVTVVGMIPIALVLVLSKLGVGVLLGLAPFAIVLLLFDATRSLFEGYLRQLLTFALIPTMIYALLGLVLGMLANVSGALATATSTGLPGLDTVAPYTMVLVLAGLLATQVTSWSSGIAGGLVLATQGALAKPAAQVASALQVLQAGKRTVADRPMGAVTGGARRFLSGASRQVLGLRPRSTPQSRRADS